ncbi:MAG: 2-oxoacid:acceptor oxidoreductase family protein [Archaeoglobaceae archaeon]|nr:2-oxoacid:acceptor oxidoreductase family protein [Archaeoglobaceae archaeon]MDW8118329.1 2-oxoacid:acceptor oxidoreductase family protein [Archaeoglobaceae archaeon]
MKVDLSFAIAGFQGGGIESAGQVAIKAFMLKGYEIFGSREYHSNIIGAHSYFHLRVGGQALKLPLDALIALDGESVFTHLQNLRKDALVVCDQNSLKTRASEIPSMSKALKSRIEQSYGSFSLEQILAKHELRVVALRMKDLMKNLAFEKQFSSISRTLNVIGVSAGLYLLGLDKETIKNALEKQFANPEINLKAMEIAIEEVRDLDRRELPDGKKEEKLILSGNEAVAMAKIHSGIEFLSFYPITPATDETLFVEKNGKGIITIQTEDEISALGMALGASIAGLRASTSTSGPGFSLMNEMISFAVQAEIPIVITLWMRASPSTGIATRTSQQDLLHSIFSGHGDTQKIVIASGDHIEAIEDVPRAFELAEKFQMPVIHLLDKFIASSITGVEKSAFKFLPKKAFNGDQYFRYKLTEDGISPFLPIGRETMVVSSLEHDEYGFATEDPVDREKMMLKRIRKFEKVSEAISKESYNVYGEESAELTIISFGSTKNAIIEAMKEFKVPTKFVQLRILSPFPDLSKELIGKVICIESNAGQLSFLLKGYCKLDGVAKKLNARPIYVNEVVKAVNALLRGQKEVILSEGA